VLSVSSQKYQPIVRIRRTLSAVLIILIAAILLILVIVLIVSIVVLTILVVVILIILVVVLILFVETHNVTSLFGFKDSFPAFAESYT